MKVFNIQIKGLYIIIGYKWNDVCYTYFCYLYKIKCMSSVWKN